MFKKGLLFAVLMFSLASVVGVAQPDGPVPGGCYPCDATGHGTYR